MAALSEKVAEAKRKKNELISRINTAEAQQRTQATETMTKDHLADSSAFDTFDRMAEKIGDTEAQGEAMMDLVGEAESAQKAEAEVEAMFDAQENDDALAALKAKMAGGDAASAGSSASPSTADPIEDELAKMRAALEGDDSKPE